MGGLSSSFLFVFPFFNVFFGCFLFRVEICMFVWMDFFLCVCFLKLIVNFLRNVRWSVLREVASFSEGLIFGWNFHGVLVRHFFMVFFNLVLEQNIRSTRKPNRNL